MAVPLIEPSATALLAVAIDLSIILMMWRARARLRHFLKAHPSIRDDQDLSAFKQLVRWNMRVARLLMGPVAVMLLCMFPAMRSLGPYTPIFIALLLLPLVLMGQKLGKIEAQARTLECPDPARQEEYVREGYAWTNKLFPDF